MTFVSEVVERFRSLLGRGREEEELDEELRFHLEMEEAANLRRGMSPAEARRRAQLVLGGVERAKEEFRDARGVRPVEDVVRDVRYAFRSLGRNPGFAAVAVLVLGLGIGANAAIFSAVRAVVLRPLPFSDPGRLYMVWEENTDKGWEQETAAPANYLDWKDRVSSFADVEAYSPTPYQVVLTDGEEPRLLRAVDVTGGFFSMVGVRPALGRTFEDAETWRSAEPVVMLSGRAWETVFGADSAVVGSLITVDDVRARVVGVMPDGFSFPAEEMDLWTTFAWPAEARSEVWFRRAHWIRPVARLARDASPEAAAAELEAVAAQLSEEYPETNEFMGAGMTPLHAFLLGDTRAPLLVLLGAVGLLLLIACANVGNLLLVRAAGRERDFAVRAALGARRGRLVQQVLIESTVLAALGGALGLAAGWVGTRVLERLQPEGLLRVSRFDIDAGVLAYIVAVSAVATLLFGAAPALFARRSSPGRTLREAGRSGGHGRGTRRAVRGLVVAEVALALMLVVGAGLLVRSVARLQDVDPGFDPEGVAVLMLNLRGDRYDTADKVAGFYDEVFARIRALPGIERVAGSTTLPLRDRGFSSDFFIAGRAPDEYGTEVVRRRVTPDYFEAMGVPVLRGRGFTGADVRGAERVAVINEALAREYFPNEDPVGQRITADRVPTDESIWRTIVGVVGSERQVAVATPAQVELIEPYDQYVASRLYVYVRMAAGDPLAVVPAVRRMVAEIDPAVPLFSADRMTDIHADSMARDRFLMVLLLAFAGVALLLALVGVYGVTAQAARQRVREIGIRIALGAGTGDVVRLTLRAGLALIGAGLVLGLVGALAASRVMASLLYDTATTDLSTYAAVAALLAAAGLLASWVPAWRAGRTDPAVALRVE